MILPQFGPGTSRIWTNRLMKAQNIDGGAALVGTTSIYTNKDMTIPPEPFTLTLAGASNILVIPS